MKAKYKLLLGRRKEYPLNIELEVYKGSDCRVFISTGISLDNERQWDKERQLILRNGNAAAYNHFLQSLILNIERAELDAEEKQIAFTKDLIRMAARNNVLLEETNAFDKFRAYLREDRTCKPSTKQHNEYFLQRLQGFVDRRKGQKNAPLHFDEITLAFIKDFDAQLCNHLCDLSRRNVHSVVRKYIKMAKRDGLIKYNPYDDFEVPHSSGEQRPSLTLGQISALENLSEEELNDLGTDFVTTRDRFLFSCYTGLRDSDSLALRKSDISHDENGLTLQLTTIKTDQQVTLPLYLLFEGKPEKIALKYLDSNPDDDLLFPIVVSTRRLKLRALLRYVGIPETCTFHTARHTCATMLAEKVNDPFVIKDILGHKGISTSMIYISRSHKSAERKLATIKWDGHANDNDSITLKSKALCKLCKDNGFSDSQLSVVIGNLMENPDKYEMIKSWVGTFTAKDCTAELIDEKLQSLFNTL